MDDVFERRRGRAERGLGHNCGPLGFPVHGLGLKLGLDDVVKGRAGRVGPEGLGPGHNRGLGQQDRSRTKVYPLSRTETISRIEASFEVSFETPRSTPELLLERLESRPRPLLGEPFGQLLEPPFHGPHREDHLCVYGLWLLQRLETV